MRAAFYLFVFACSLGLAAPTDSSAQESDAQNVNLSTDQARAVTVNALRSGNPGVADAISSALLAQNPDDAQMLLVRAILARQAGRFDVAQEAASRAYANSESDAVSFESALVVADVLARDEKYLRSEFWLRRADQAASNEGQERAVERLFRQVNARNPLSIQLRFSARPSNNVNNGAEELVIEIGGLPFRLSDSGQQLGGYETSVGLSLGYRLSEDATQRTEALLELFHRDIRLDSDAKDDAPDVEGSDFDYSVVIVGLRQQRLIWPDLGPTSFTGLLGQSWYGEKKLARWFELSGRQSVRLADDRVLTFGATARTELRLDGDINDSKQFGLSVDYRQAIEGAGSFGLGATIRDIRSDSATVDRFSTEIRGDRVFGQIGPMVPRISLSLQNQNYHKFTSTIDGRQDRSATLGLSATFPDVRFYGFVPEASIRARKTNSNVDIYDRNEYSFGVTMVSRF